MVVAMTATAAGGSCSGGWGERGTLLVLSVAPIAGESSRERAEWLRLRVNLVSRGGEGGRSGAAAAVAFDGIGRGIVEWSSMAPGTAIVGAIVSLCFTASDATATPLEDPAATVDLTASLEVKECAFSSDSMSM